MARRGSRERTLKILAAIPAEIKKAVRVEIEKQAGAIVEMQKRLVPVESGALRDSIRYAMGDVSLASSANLAAGTGAKVSGSKNGGSGGGNIKGDPDLTATIIAGNRKAWYARYVEFGTQRHSLAKGAVAPNAKKKRKGKQQNEGYQHPGAAAHPFFYGPYRANKRRAKSAVSRAIGKAVKEVANKS